MFSIVLFTYVMMGGLLEPELIVTQTVQLNAYTDREECDKAAFKLNGPVPTESPFEAYRWVAAACVPTR